MAVNTVFSPFPLFTDADGHPLEAGYIWIGVEGLNPETNPVAVFWDEKKTQPAAQPVRTINGYPSRDGTPSALYTAGSYGITVRDRRKELVFSDLSAGYSIILTIDRFFDDVTALLADTTPTYPTGTILNTRAEGFAYEVVTAAEDLTTAGGVKLRVLATGNAYAAASFGWSEDATETAQYDALVLLWAAAMRDGADMSFGPGVIDIGDRNYPFRQSDASGGLLDCGGISIRATPQTIFKTTSADGADVFQLNGLSNFNIIGFPTVTGALTAYSGSGSNGVSITNGFDRLYIEVTAVNCESVDSGSFIDGGKALSIQPSTTANPCGSLVAKVRAKGCAYGFGADLDLVTVAGKKMAVDVDIVAEDCYSACVISAGAATAAISDGTQMGIQVRGYAINCQRDVILGRAHGVSVDMQVITTKTAAARRLDTNGVTWRATSTDVEALFCAYARNSIIRVVGDKADCDYKAEIGGSAAGASGLNGATSNCSIILDVFGTAATADINAINSGGNVVRDSRVEISSRTATGVPALFLDPALGNQITFGSENRLTDLSIRGAIGFTGSDNDAITYHLAKNGTAISLRQEASSAPTAKVLEVQDNAGNPEAGFLNNGGLMTNARETSAAALSTKIQNLLIYDGSGALVGKVPIYSS